MFKKSLLFIALFHAANFAVLANEQKAELKKASETVHSSMPALANISTAKQTLMAKIANLSAFSADFTQKVVDADGNPLQENSGNLAVDKPNLLHWQVTAPNESLIVSDGKALWLYDPFIEQVSVYATDGAMSNTPILLLANPDKSIWQNYTVKLLNNEHYLITAKDDNSQVKSLELQFDKQNQNQNPNELTTLNEFVILDATGQLSRVQLTNVKPLTKKHKSLFTFTSPEGVEIDDQR